MSELVRAVIGFAVLFAVFGLYGLLRPRTECTGGCGSCGAADSCGRAQSDSHRH